MSLGKNIRKKRIALGLSQQKLADAMGYRNRSSITKIEKDQSPVTGDQLQRLAQILHTTVGYLANDEPETELPKGIIIPDPSVLNPPEQRRSKQRCADYGAIHKQRGGETNEAEKHGMPFPCHSIDRRDQYYKLPGSGRNHDPRADNRAQADPRQ